MMNKFEVGDILINPYADQWITDGHGEKKLNPFYCVIYLGSNKVIAGNNSVHEMYIDDDQDAIWRKVSRIDFAKYIITAVAINDNAKLAEMCDKLKGHER